MLGLAHPRSKTFLLFAGIACALVSVVDRGHVSAAAQAAPDQAGITPQAVATGNRAGSTVKVCGTAILATCKLDTNTFLLHLDQPDWTQAKSVAIVMPQERRLLPGWENAFLQRSVCATGTVERRGEGYAIKVTDPAQPVVDKEPAQPVTVFGSTATRCDPRGFEARPISTPGATYPVAALDAKRCGDISLELLVQPDGSVGDVRVVHSIDPTPNGLDQAAAAAAKRWKFEPALRPGQPAATIIVIEMNFHIKGTC